MAKPPEPAVTDFERDLLESAQQAQRGEFAEVHTPDKIAARRGRPVGSVKTVRKVPTTIRFDADVVEGLKARGPGWQTRANDALRDWLQSHPTA